MEPEQSPNSVREDTGKKLDLPEPYGREFAKRHFRHCVLGMIEVLLLCVLLLIFVLRDIIQKAPAPFGVFLTVAALLIGIVLLDAFLYRCPACRNGLVRQALSFRYCPRCGARPQ
jgi:uncharacterized protein (DUF3820 family)